MTPIRDVLDRLQEAERRFAGTEFLAPLIGAGEVSVRIAGVVCRLRVTEDLPPDFSGWAVLRALSTRQARFVRPAGLAEIARYLALFPSLRLILLQPEPQVWLAVPAQHGDTRFNIQGMVTLWFPEPGLERFETVMARFDGRLFFYERRDPGRDPSIAAYLRDQLSHEDAAGLPPEPATLHRPGMSREEREAYGLWREAIARARRDRVKDRLADALAHAGAGFRSYVDRGDVYVVTYEVDGRQHMSTIRRDDLTVMTAGICLSGQDRRFDLTSLVSVLREGRQRGRLVWVGGDDLPEDEYWNIHPPGGPQGQRRE